MGGLPVQKPSAQHKRLHRTTEQTNKRAKEDVPDEGIEPGLSASEVDALSPTRLTVISR
jgi:hypothetical protein